ncbi:hypothetical protein H5202_23140, partial [Shewanella sp. SG41-4]|uniref:DUF6194 family protein n=1 Tax=Shewanella sp. SG41-4 TaxID=2760976 RepID=UPI001602C7DD
MHPESIIEKIVSSFEGIVPKSSWGETSLFYNPGKALPNGVYFCTIKEKDGDNDKSSKLDRAGVYRLSFGISRNSYERLFGDKPKRPAKGCTVNAEHDFTVENKLIMHPIYGWMSWVQILNPTESMFTEVFPLITEAHSI